MIIDCISDLHGHYPKLEGGDLLIVARDWTATTDIYELFAFGDWLYNQPYKKKIFIAGNHDNEMVSFSNFGFQLGRQPFSSCDYLYDSGTEFQGLKIWGSPWTKRFEGMNPKAMAFTLDTEEELAEKWAMIPDDTDILITHCPPNGIMDYVLTRETKWGNAHEHVGSLSLRNEMMNRVKPRLHIFGHIHEWGGKQVDLCTTIVVNASHVNERYEPVNKPARIEI